MWYTVTMEEEIKTAAGAEESGIGPRTRAKKNKTIPKPNGAVKVMAVFIGMILLSLLINHMMNWFSPYEGLEEPQLIPAQEYNLEAFFYTEDGRLHYEDENWTSRQVVDVSSYQNVVDWQQVAADGIEMAVIRVGYRGYESGLLNLDTFFETNAEGAAEAGLEVGVYFFSQAVTVEEAEDEARFVLKQIRGKKVTGPVAFDMEHIEGADRISHLTREEKTAIADAFCQLIEKNGYEAVIYGNPLWLTGDINLSQLTAHDVWLAHYTALSYWPAWYGMWQYTDRGTVAGIQGGVDLNVQMVRK